jgi:hypothetical protein
MFASPYPLLGVTPAYHQTDDVYYDTLVCMATHSASVEKELRRAILDSETSDEALQAVEPVIFKDPETRSLEGTARQLI